MWSDDLTQLAEHRGQDLRRFAYLLTHDWHDADDLVQESLLRAFTSLRRPGNQQDLERYVRKTMTNSYIDRWRWRRRRQRIRADAPSVPSHEQSISETTSMQQALATLSPRQRACVVLRYYYDLSGPEIGAELGCSAGTVRRHLHDALSRLQRHLAAEETSRDEH